MRLRTKLAPMTDDKFPRSLIRQIESHELPLLSLGAIRALRDYLDRVEAERTLEARALGATASDIASALRITRQAVHNRLRALGQRDDTIVIPELEHDEPEPDR